MDAKKVLKTTKSIQSLKNKIQFYSIMAGIMQKAWEGRRLYIVPTSLGVCSETNKHNLKDLGYQISENRQGETIIKWIKAPYVDNTSEEG